jgi:CDP-paratose 2-epimerase
MTKYELTRTGYSADLARDFNKNELEGMGVDIRVEDVRDKKALFASAKECDFIVHTAAQPAMTISWEDPELDFSTNVRGTFNVLEAAKEFKIPMVSCGTIHIYGNEINETLIEDKTRYRRDPAEIGESEPVAQGVLTPLHASKRAGELYVKTYIDTYDVKAASFRLTGLYGPRQFGGEDHGWVANFSIRAAMGRPLTIYGTGKQVRDILYATDLCEAFHAFYENPVPGIYNVGGESRQSISLLECIDVIEEIIGKKPEVKFEEGRHGDLLYFICDCTRARRRLGWEAKTVPREGIRRLIEWIKANKEIFAP